MPNLLVLNYMLALGQTFDLVINIDGFNEVALPPITNLPNQVNPFFPRNWFGKTAALKDASSPPLKNRRLKTSALMPLLEINHSHFWAAL